MYDFRKRSDDAKLFNTEKSMTKQDFTAQCDINNIMKKYIKNGVNPFVITADAKYGDFSNIPSYDQALCYVMAAEEAFDQLPAHIRSKFEYDPQKLMDFIGDDKNYEEAVKMGIVEKKEPQAPMKVEVVNQPVQKVSEQLLT